MKLFKKKSSDSLVVASINGHICRCHFFSTKENTLKLRSYISFDYADLDQLEGNLAKWQKQLKEKNIELRWLLSHELYETYLTDAPNVLEKEMAEAIKWQIKDQLELGLDKVLISYYKPNHPDPENTQLVAVSVEKTLVERLIEISRSINLDLEVIEIEELALGHALLPHLPENQIVGYVGENKSGLVFSFYQNNQLVFSRFKKGLFLPTVSVPEFTLEEDQSAVAAGHINSDDEDAFLLETQRTLDYVIGQLFRKPIDLILLQQNSQSDVHNPLADTINQLVETKVSFVQPTIEDLTENEAADGANQSPENERTITNMPTLAEAGCALRTVA